MNPYLLLFTGLFLIFLEFFLPGIILGTLGVICFLASWFFFLQGQPAWWEVVLFFGGSLALLYGVIKYALWRIPRARPGLSIYLKGEQTGYVASHYDKKAIGKTGVVLTDLKPGGYILIDGIQHQALSETGYLTKGEEIEVIGGEGESLIVKRRKK